MEKLTVNQKSPKQANKAKKKPLKVVYISNPVKLTATAAQFRAIVQELTGRDSNIAETMVDEFGDSSITDMINPKDEQGMDLAAGDRKVGVGSKGLADQTVELADHEAFTSPLLDNFSALCESQHVGSGFWEY